MVKKPILVMKKSSLSLLFSGLLAVALVGGTAVNAADTKTKSADASKAAVAQKPKAKRNWYPFYGTVAAVDKQAKTISLKKKQGERVLKLDSKSELLVNDNPATLADVKVGSYAHGKLHKNASGAEVITSAKFDKEAPPKKKKASEKKPAKQAD